MDAVATDNLCKSYGRTQVLHDVSLRVPNGSLFGFLGPNGAGKTTTIRILLGLLRASAGAAHVLGRDAWRDGAAVRAEIGYLPGDVRFYDGLSGRRTLAFLDAARHANARGEINRLCKLLDLDLDKRVRSYSRGMKQKLGLIQALMHRPKLLILDEPTIALDPLVRHALFEELRRIAEEGRTVLFSSHTLGEVEQLCDHVAILRDGRLIEQAPTEVLRRRAVRHVEVIFESADAPPPAPDELTVTNQADGLLTGTWVGEVQPLIAWLAQCRVREVTLAPPDLEDLFMAYYEGSPGEGTP